MSGLTPPLTGRPPQSYRDLSQTESDESGAKRAPFLEYPRRQFRDPDQQADSVDRRHRSPTLEEEALLSRSSASDLSAPSSRLLNLFLIASTQHVHAGAPHARKSDHAHRGLQRCDLHVLEFEGLRDPAFPSAEAAGR